MNVPIVLLLACVPAPGESVHDPDHDFDGDGLSELDGDCDDGDATRTLLATVYVDADEDGHGDAATGFESCGPAEGAVPTADDCDDADPAFHPGAADACGDGVDHACDAGETCAIAGALTGADALGIVRAGAWEGGLLSWIDGGTAPPSVGVGTSHRGTLPGLPTAGDRVFELSVVGGEVATVDLGFEQRGWHARLHGVGDIDGDGVGDRVAGSYCWSGDAVCDDPGYAVLLFGPIDPGSLAEQVGVRLEGVVGACVGITAAPLDVGFVLTGACDNEDDGVVWIVDRATAAAGSPVVLGYETRLYGTEPPHVGSGWALATGDLDADGADDVAVAPWAGGLGLTVFVHYVAAEIVDGPVHGSVVLESDDQASLNPAGTQLATIPGADGADRLVVGAAGGYVFGSGERRIGHVWILSAPAGGDLDGADARIDGPVTSFGAAVGSAGDVDRDGFVDLLVGAPDDDSDPVFVPDAPGSAWLVDGGHLEAGGTIDLAAATLATFVGASGAHLGISAVGGDLDGDGWPEVVIGQENPEPDGAAAWVFAGGTLD